MSGGIARRPKRAKPVVEPEAEPEMVQDEPEADDEPEVDVDEPEVDVEMPVDPVLPAEAKYRDDPEDPEDHFVADDDATPRVTGGGKSEAAE
jgi:hypothetical protein